MRRYIADGVAELCENYAIDGIHMDDYFYPTTDEAFDAADYAAYCEGTGAPLPLDDWRRENVDALVEACRAVTRAAGVRFGIAPQGQPALCYGAQYSDAAGWLAEGLVDILMPQLYWGRDYTADGDNSLALDTLAAEWLAMDRAPGVSLCFGLGAYRIGEGDGSDRTGPGTEWLSGHALADQAEALAALGADGVGLYRYDSPVCERSLPHLRRTGSAGPARAGRPAAVGFAEQVRLTRADGGGRGFSSRSGRVGGGFSSFGGWGGCIRFGRRRAAGREGQAKARVKGSARRRECFIEITAFRGVG